jgi:hypothetical protein
MVGARQLTAKPVSRDASRRPLPPNLATFGDIDKTVETGSVAATLKRLQNARHE